MADIGVLNLTIQDNASEAANGLGQLERKLKGVKTAAEGYNLSPVKRQIESVVNAVKGSEKTAAALGTLFNAIANYAKIKIPKIDLTPIKELQEAFGEGIKIGNTGSQLNQLRVALQGEWNEEKARTAGDVLKTIAEGVLAFKGSNIGTVANGISKLATALNEYADAAERLKKVFGSSGTVQESVQDTVGQATKAYGGAVGGWSRWAFMGSSPQNGSGGRKTSSAEGVLERPIMQQYELLERLQKAQDAFFAKKPEEIIPDTKQSESVAAIQKTEETIQSAKAAQSDFLVTTERITRQEERTNETIEEQLRLRREMLDAENQQRLERSYSQYRELFLSKEGDWEKQVPEMYGFTPAAIEQGETYAEALAITMREVDEYVDNFIDQMNTPVGELLRDTIDQANEAKLSYKDAAESAATLKYAPELDTGMQNVQSTVQTMSSSLEGAKTATRVLTESMEDLDTELKQKKTDMSNVSEETKSLKARFDSLMASTKGLKGAFTKLFPKTSGLLKHFAGTIVSRSIRYTIRTLASALNEGIKNVYEYSKAVGTNFSPAMDEAASSLLKMKNSIGAALAPAIVSLVPVLQTVVNWFVNLINYVNQFFALLNGQATWTKALETQTEAYKETAKSAKAASDATKDLLADWDELNIIQSSNNGSGSSPSSSAVDYTTMFEEVSEYDQGVRDFVKFVKDNFVGILTSVLGIKTALKAWKLSSALTKYFPFLSKLAEGVALGATIALTVTLTDLTGKAFIDTGNPAYFIADALTGAVGSYLARRIATKLAGAPFGTVTQGFTLILAGAVNIKNAIDAVTQEKESEAWMLGVLGSIESGIGAGLVAAGFGAATGVSIAAGVATFGFTLLITAALIIDAKKKATYRKMAIDAFRQTGENGISAEEYLTALQTRLDELTSDSELVVNASLGLDEHSESFKSTIESLKALNALVSGGEALSEDDANKFKNAWEIVLNELSEISEISYATIYAGLDEAIANGSEKIKNEALELRAEAIRAAGIMGGAEEALKKEMEFLENEILMGRKGNDNYDEALKRYKEIYSELSGTTETGLNEFKAALQEGARFDFTGEENPVQAAVDFIGKIGTDLLTPALEKAQEQYDAEIKGIEESQKTLEKYHNLKLIGDDEYNELNKYYNDQIDFFTRRLEEQKREIQSSTQEAINAIASQSLEGYFALDEDEDALKAYVDNVLVPLKKAIEESGNEVPKELAAVIARNGRTAVFADAADQLRESSREAIYQSFIDDYQAGNIDDPVKFAIAYEIDLVNSGKNVLADPEEEKRDIINSLYNTFGDPDIFDMLNKAFGWDYQDMINAIDISGYTDEELADLQETIDILNRFDNLDLKMPEIDNNTVLEQTDNAAKMYEDMASRMQAACETVNGLEYNMNTPGINGIRMPTAAGFRAAGMTTSDVGWAQYNPNGGNSTEVEVVNQETDEQKRTNISQGTSSLLEALNSILRVAEAINRKEFVVNVNPSTGLAQTVEKSDYRLERVRG